MQMVHREVQAEAGRCALVTLLARLLTFPPPAVPGIWVFPALPKEIKDA